MNSDRGVPILMYHSVSKGPGPVSLDPTTFREQLAVVRDAGFRAISVSEYVAARRGHSGFGSGTVVLTFDDGYRDFADVVFPCLQAAGWGCTVFLPVGPIDAGRPWDCGDDHVRELMTWPMIEELAARGVEFGAHSMTHRDLTRLPPDAARDEIVRSGEQIRARTGRVEGFAPPFGRATSSLRQEMRQHYTWVVGTDMALADDRSDLFDLPRLEMWYFRDVKRWRRYISRGWTPYFALRRAMRAIREAV